MLTQSKSDVAIAAMNPDELFEYFSSNAGYYKENPLNSCYVIRFGNKFHYSSDTSQLLNKFKEAIKKYRRRNPEAVKAEKLSKQSSPARVLTKRNRLQKTENVLR